MISQIFKTGGGAGIGSYVIVFKNGELLKPSAEKIRWAYDSGENLFLSIIDDETEEALLPLTGYVDNNGVLHLSGRDFDDNMTYTFSIDGKSHEIETEIVEGITLGDGTIGENSNFKVYEYEIADPEAHEILTPEQMADIMENQYDLIKVHVKTDPGSYDPGSYEPGSYDPQDTEMILNFNKVQYVSNVEGEDVNILTYATGVTFEKIITMMDIIDESGHYSYELGDVNVGGGSGGDYVECQQLRVENHADIQNPQMRGIISINNDYLSSYISNGLNVSIRSEDNNSYLNHDMSGMSLQTSVNNQVNGEDTGISMTSSELQILAHRNGGGYTEGSYNIRAYQGGNGSLPSINIHLERQAPIPGEEGFDYQSSNLEFLDGVLYINRSSSAEPDVQPGLMLGSQLLDESTLQEIKTIHGGTQLYKHYLGYQSIPNSDYMFYFYVISNVATPITDMNELESQIKALGGVSCVRARNITADTNAVLHLFVDYGNLFILLPDGSELQFSTWDFSGGDTVTVL